MCHDWQQEYTECCHVSRELVHCPSYYKQRDAAKGLFGRILHSSAKDKEHCGHVIPHHGQPVAFCHDCTVRHNEFRARYVGDGTLRVYRPVVDDSSTDPFKQRREQRKQEALETERLERLERRQNSREKERSDRDPQPRNLAPTDKSSSVPIWIPELYDRQQSLARNEAYARIVKTAPPVSPSRSSKPSTSQPLPSKAKKEETTAPRYRQAPSSRPQEHSRFIYVDRKWAYEKPLPPPPPKKEEEPTPTPPRHTCRRLSGSGSTKSQAEGPPPTTLRRTPIPRSKRQSSHARPVSKYTPLPRPKRNSGRAWAANIPRGLTPKSSRTDLRATDASKTRNAPPLRRKPGQVHRAFYRKTPPPVPRLAPKRPAPVAPLPEYQVYLNALSFAKNSPPTSEAAASTAASTKRKGKGKASASVSKSNKVRMPFGRTTNATTTSTSTGRRGSTSSISSSKPKLAREGSLHKILRRGAMMLELESAPPRTATPDSDISFFCQHSKQVSLYGTVY
ncbi:uncharacterized protein GGS25DRAFT_532719 [Hypoxylon fragiforme]|uniref:uncharacterized protein n=1 Tax=Hypoxylon fragiforme TaxID=63214 RepID=UPI0020C690CF|nr:uncharacterized protein GGS25DRAFT_532719 [Hypoxylon fragiforme]KAI2607655.1 hypothetical protein GGS25DRAFT_532719 [Hypoxylon fragiforme]